MAGAIILMLTYGYSVKPDGSDPLVKLIDTLLQRFSYSTQAGAWLVDLLPFRAYSDNLSVDRCLTMKINFSQTFS